MGGSGSLLYTKMILLFRILLEWKNEKEKKGIEFIAGSVTDTKRNCERKKVPQRS